MSLPRLAACLSVLLLGGCASAGEHWVELGGARYHVELAQDDATRARGLMFRDHMDADRGMLFIHDRVEPHALNRPRFAASLGACPTHALPCRSGTRWPSWPTTRCRCCRPRC